MISEPVSFRVFTKSAEISRLTVFPQDELLKALATCSAFDDDDDDAISAFVLILLGAAAVGHVSYEYARGFLLFLQALLGKHPESTEKIFARGSLDCLLLNQFFDIIYFINESLTGLGAEMRSVLEIFSEGDLVDDTEDDQALSLKGLSLIALMKQ